VDLAARGAISPFSMASDEDMAAGQSMWLLRC